MNSKQLMEALENSDRADKMIKYQEFKEKIDDLKSSNFSLIEKFTYAAHKPLFITSGLISGFFNSKVQNIYRQNVYRLAIPKPSEIKDFFMSGHTLAEIVNHVNWIDKVSPFKNLAFKYNELALQAFDTSKDYSEEFKAGKMRFKF